MDEKLMRQQVADFLELENPSWKDYQQLNWPHGKKTSKVSPEARQKVEAVLDGWSNSVRMETYYLIGLGLTPDQAIRKFLHLTCSDNTAAHELVDAVYSSGVVIPSHLSININGVVRCRSKKEKSGRAEAIYKLLTGLLPQETLDKWIRKFRPNQDIIDMLDMLDKDKPTQPTPKTEQVFESIFDYGE